MIRWRVRKESIWLVGGYSGEGRSCRSRVAWSVYYGDKRVARYTTWRLCCDHIATAHRRFGL